MNRRNIRKELEQIGKSIRWWAEKQAPTRGIKPESLQGMCAQAARMTFRALQFSFPDIPAFICGSRGYHSYDGDVDHVYAEFEGYLIDVTATQFDVRFPRVNVVHVDKAENMPRTLSPSSEKSISWIWTTRYHWESERELTRALSDWDHWEHHVTKTGLVRPRLSPLEDMRASKKLAKLRRKIVI
jgi:hypothetical protein